MQRRHLLKASLALAAYTGIPSTGLFALQAFANPARFLKIARPVTPFLLWAGLAHAGVEVEVLGLDGIEKENVEQRLRIRASAKSPELDDLLVEGLHARAEDDNDPRG